MKLTAFHALGAEVVSNYRTAEGGHPTLRAEREALSLIHFLRDQGHPQSECLAALSADQTLSEPVRQRALQFAREWK